MWQDIRESAQVEQVPCPHKNTTLRRASKQMAQVWLCSISAILLSSCLRRSPLPAAVLESLAALTPEVFAATWAPSLASFNERNWNW